MSEGVWLSRAYAYLFPRNWRRYYSRSYEFTCDYFTPRAGLWNRILAPFKGRSGLQALEVGTYEGRSAIWLLENVLTDPSASLTCIDPYGKIEEVEARFLNNLDLSGLRHKVSLIKDISSHAMPLLSPATFHLIYLDGDHSPEVVYSDALQAWRLLAPGGILIVDDYEWPDAPVGCQPAIGLDRFLGSVSDKGKVLYRQRQLILGKAPHFHF